MENTSLKDLLREHLELKGLTPKKAAELTGVPERYIEALLTGNDKFLPPAAYVHGYLTKLALILNFDKDSMWRLYQKEAVALQRSGPSDRLPSNRFAVHYLNKKWLLAGLIIILIIAYLIPNVFSLFLAPEIELTNPAGETLNTFQPRIILTGRTDPSYTLTINGEEVYVKEDGNFEKEYQLQFGLNTIEFSVKKFLGKENKVVRQIMYQPAPPPAILNNVQNPIREGE